jgi:hypothetical protein
MFDSKSFVKFSVWQKSRTKVFDVWRKVVKGGDGGAEKRLKRSYSA